MARLKLELPETFIFSTEISLRINDINYGGHLGNDVVLSLVHEARAHFFRAHGFTELDVDGVGIFMHDAAIVFRSEAFYGETLVVEIAASDVRVMEPNLAIWKMGQMQDMNRQNTVAL